jgi:hypothetical protein
MINLSRRGMFFLGFGLGAVTILCAALLLLWATSAHASTPLPLTATPTVKLTATPTATLTTTPTVPPTATQVPPTDTPSVTPTVTETETPTTTLTATPTATPDRGTSIQFTSAPANSAAHGQDVTLSAQVKTADGSAATGTITFTSKNAPICGPVPVNSSGIAICVTNNLVTGANVLVATYNGDAAHAGSSSPLSILITPADTVASISASSHWNGIPVWGYNATATVKASGSAIPQGLVTFHFSDRGAVNRDMSCSLGNDGSCSVSFADSLLYYIVTVTYPANVDFNGSSSGAVSTGR